MIRRLSTPDQSLSTAFNTLLRTVTAAGELACPSLTPSYNYWRTQTAGFASPAPERPTLNWQEDTNSDRGTAFTPGEALRQEAEVGGKRAEFETGRFASLSDGSCLLQIGGTQVLATAVAAGQNQQLFRRHHFALPLTVEYQERSSALGKFPGGYQRREGGSDHESLVAASVERAVAPQFPPGFLRSVQVSTMLLSSDGAVAPDVLAINAASAALMCSNIPWGGPVAAVRVALIRGRLVVNPPPSAAAGATLSLLYAGSAREAVVVDLQARQVFEEAAIRAIRLAHNEACKLIPPQLELARLKGRRKARFSLAGADPAAAQRVAEKGKAGVAAILQDVWQTVSQRNARLADAKAGLLEEFKSSGFFRIDAMRVPGSGCVSPMDLDHAWSHLVGSCLREMVLDANMRPDGRGLIDLRPAQYAMHVLPVPHGSALSSVGDSQVLSAVTLGGLKVQRESELANNRGHSHFFVHYTSSAGANNAVSEWRQRGPSRSEQLKGMFLEQALQPLLPSEAAFPFAVRVNADVLAANGSLAEVAVNSTALALQAANVSLAGPVAGLSLGLISEGRAPQLAGSTQETEAHQVQRYAPQMERWELLCDTQGIEEEFSDMHLATAGTRAGLVALQLHCSVPGIPLAALEAAIRRALPARLRLLDSIEAAGKPDRTRGPQFGRMEIAKEHIGRLVGPNGSVLRGIEDSTGAGVTLQEDGVVHYFGPTPEKFKAAEETIGSITGNTIKEGDKYRVTVKRLQDYGAFVELPNGYQTLLHISEISHTRVRSVEEVLEVGQELEVLCLGRDGRGFIRVSRRALLEPIEPQTPPRMPPTPRTAEPQKSE